ncbi:SDR family NAD(P)-dependent oxidoreductase [Sphingomonas sp. RB1R13]|uniref:SDR family NAD(P)-dependent oxidoreductase n=1 Tax=Sphingomonas sp. RB1R13 TaxID=3096159 RepID=UPI002FC72B33
MTGGASGIGRATVRRLRDHGVRVAVLDLTFSEEGNANIVADLGSDASVAAAMEKVRATTGLPDIVIHAAAASVSGSVMTTSSADFARLYDVNVIGAARLIRACAPAMIEKGRGSFVMVSSVNARFATPTLAAYAASKAGLENLVMTAAVELAPSGVRVNAVAPASIDTPLLRASFADAPDPQQALRENALRHPLARLGAPEEVAHLIAFLCSIEADWITGGVHPIDGGAHVTRR